MKTFVISLTGISLLSWSLAEVVVAAPPMFEKQIKCVAGLSALNIPAKRVTMKDGWKSVQYNMISYLTDVEGGPMLALTGVRTKWGGPLELLVLIDKNGAYQLRNDEINLESEFVQWFHCDECSGHTMHWGRDEHACLEVAMPGRQNFFLAMNSERRDSDYAHSSVRGKRDINDFNHIRWFKFFVSAAPTLQAIKKDCDRGRSLVSRGPKYVQASDFLNSDVRSILADRILTMLSPEEGLPSYVYGGVWGIRTALTDIRTGGNQAALMDRERKRLQEGADVPALENATLARLRAYDDCVDALSEVQKEDRKAFKDALDAAKASIDQVFRENPEIKSRLVKRARQSGALPTTLDSGSSTTSTPASSGKSGTVR